MGQGDEGQQSCGQSSIFLAEYSELFACSMCNQSRGCVSGGVLTQGGGQLSGTEQRCQILTAITYTPPWVLVSRYPQSPESHALPLRVCIFAWEGMKEIPVPASPPGPSLRERCSLFPPTTLPAPRPGAAHPDRGRAVPVPGADPGADRGGAVEQPRSVPLWETLGETAGRWDAHGF